MTGTPGTLTVEAKTLAPLGRPAEGRPLQFQRPSMEAAKPGSRSRSTDVFLWVVQGRRVARRPPSRRPSRFPRLPVPQTERALSNLAPPSAGQPSTNAGPTEMPMKQHEPE